MDEVGRRARRSTSPTISTGTRTQKTSQKLLRTSRQLRTSAPRTVRFSISTTGPARPSQTKTRIPGDEEDQQADDRPWRRRRGRPGSAACSRAGGRSSRIDGGSSPSGWVSETADGAAVEDLAEQAGHGRPRPRRRARAAILTPWRGSSESRLTSARERVDQAERDEDDDRQQQQRRRLPPVGAAIRRVERGRACGGGLTLAAPAPGLDPAARLQLRLARLVAGTRLRLPSSGISISSAQRRCQW